MAGAKWRIGFEIVRDADEDGVSGELVLAVFDAGLEDDFGCGVGFEWCGGGFDAFLEIAESAIGVLAGGKRVKNSAGSGLVERCFSGFEVVGRVRDRQVAGRLGFVMRGW